MKKLTPKLAVLVLVLSVTYLLYFVDRSQGVLLNTAVALAAVSWWFAYKGLSWKEALTIGVLMRFGALFAFPLLSDDIYRFLWDGELWLAGYHQLDFIPVEAPESFKAGHEALLLNMNSAGYHTVYPLVSQIVFGLAAKFGASLEMSTVLLKLPLFLAELGVLRLLYLLDKAGSRTGVAAYALLPLPVIELIGNAHFEGLAMLGVLGALYALPFGPSRSTPPTLGQFRNSSGLLGIGVLTKLVPLLTAPAIALAILWNTQFSNKWNWGNAVSFSIRFILTVALGMYIFLNGADLSGFGESLNLYFQKFEFNGSLYVLASAMGEWYKGWNWIAVIGPSLSILSMLSIITLAVVRGWKKLDLVTTLLFSFGIYILCATTVHPWYAIYLVALAPLTKYKWPYVLGFSVFLCYLAYGTEDIVVPLWATIVEYGLVLGVLIYELRNPNFSQLMCNREEDLQSTDG